MPSGISLLASDAGEVRVGACGTGYWVGVGSQVAHMAGRVAVIVQLMVTVLAGGRVFHIGFAVRDGSNVNRCS